MLEENDILDQPEKKESESKKTVRRLLRVLFAVVAALVMFGLLGQLLRWQTANLLLLLGIFLGLVWFVISIVYRNLR